MIPGCADYDVDIARCASAFSILEIPFSISIGVKGDAINPSVSGSSIR
jgi:hypothetical protein